MPTRRALWRGALARALVAAASFHAAPALACPTMTVAELADRLPGATRFEAGGELLPSFLLIWRQHRADALPTPPEGVAVFAPAGGPLLLAYRRGDCLLGLVPASPDEVWRTLREQIGPIA